jgi:hypothetical protein
MTFALVYLILHSKYLRALQPPPGDNLQLGGIVVSRLSAKSKGE